MRSVIVVLKHMHPNEVLVGLSLVAILSLHVDDEVQQNPKSDYKQKLGAWMLRIGIVSPSKGIFVAPHTKDLQCCREGVTRAHWGCFGEQTSLCFMYQPHVRLRTC